LRLGDSPSRFFQASFLQKTRRKKLRPQVAKSRKKGYETFVMWQAMMPHACKFNYKEIYLSTNFAHNQDLEAINITENLLTAIN
jgi:hypothetical protein